MRRAADNEWITPAELASAFATWRQEVREVGIKAA